MFHGHFFLMVVYAACVAVVGGFLTKDALPEQIRAAGAMWGGLVGAGIVAGWLLFVLPL